MSDGTSTDGIASLLRTLPDRLPRAVTVGDLLRAMGDQGIAVVLLMFALLVFSMFIQLVIESCRREIRLLITLGTAPRQLQRFLLRQFIPMYIVIGIASLALLAGAQWWASGLLARHNMFVPVWPAPMTYAATFGILALVYLVNWFAVRRHIASV